MAMFKSYMLNYQRVLEQMTQVSQSWEFPTLGEVHVKSREIHTAPLLIRSHQIHSALADFISSSRNPPNPSLFPKRVSTRLQLGPGFRAPTATQLYPSLRTSGWSISVRGPRAKMGQDAPRWAKIGQNCGFESTHNLSVRICIDSSFQQTAIYLGSATLSLALVLIYVVERCWGHQSKIISKSCS